MKFSRTLLIRLIISLLMLMASVLILGRSLETGDLLNAFRLADLPLIILAVLVIVLTIMAKAWRWQVILARNGRKPALGPLFRSLVIGQFVNILIPIRLGEVARIISLESSAHVSKASATSSLVVEKVLDALALFISMIVILPLVIVPEDLISRGYRLLYLSAVLLPLLAVAAWQANALLSAGKKLLSRLPQKWNRRLLKLIAALLDGIGALKDLRQTLILSGITGLILVLSVLTPLILFFALRMGLGVVEAALVNLFVTLGTAPPTIPGKALIFVTLCTIALRHFGISNDAAALSYAIIFLLVVYLPPLVIGSIAVSRSQVDLRALSDVKGRIDSA